MSEDQEQPNDQERQAAVKLYVDLVNSERQAIWARNAAMLVGNSFIANSMKTSVEGDSTPLNVAFSLAGMAICLIWAVMTWRGWGTFHHLTLEARSIVPGPLNPFSSSRNRIKRGHDVIFQCTMALIVVFFALYVMGLVDLLGQISRG